MIEKRTMVLFFVFNFDFPQMISIPRRIQTTDFADYMDCSIYIESNAKFMGMNSKRLAAVWSVKTCSRNALPNVMAVNSRRAGPAHKIF